MLRRTLLVAVMSFAAMSFGSVALAGGAGCGACTAAEKPAKCVCTDCTDCALCKEGKCAECTMACCKPKAEKPAA